MHHKCGTGSSSSQVAESSRSQQQADAQSNASDDAEGNPETDDAQSDDTDNTAHSAKKVKAEIHPEPTSLPVGGPISLQLNMPRMTNPPVIPVDLPEQTEPEDLSMSTGRMVLAGNKSSSSGNKKSGSGSSTAQSSPSSDIIKEEEDEDDRSSGNAFPRKLRRKGGRRPDMSGAGSSAS